MHLVSQSPSDTQAIAAQLAEKVLANMPGHAKATVVALRGELGAGKTTFAQGFARALGIAEQPKSPTFNLVKIYKLPDSAIKNSKLKIEKLLLWHIDCYRLEGRNDLVALDIHTAFEEPNNIILIEWPERIGDGLPREHIEVHMTHESETQRGITINF